MLMLIPTYRVTFEIPANQEMAEYPVEWRVSEDDVDAFTKILRWNGVTKYAVEQEVGP